MIIRTCCAYQRIKRWDWDYSVCEWLYGKYMCDCGCHELGA